MKRLLLLSSLLLGLLHAASGQESVQDVISWHPVVQKMKNGAFKATLSATIKKGWHIYTATPGGDGSQVPTKVSFHSNPHIRLTGKLAVTGKVRTEEIKELDYSINYYENKVSFSQNLEAGANTVLEAAVEFQACNDVKCLVLTVEKFNLEIGRLSRQPGPARIGY
ncbi:protein-disulfide reductase DsbD domain-containing protein [Taibaiella chishuiensis]|uniref:Disulfide bond corrector protein DsbC n=1 Tax=Taibaiella chishuiensis TaxID=1434707 RepID=A0A2P8DCF9_9BACT|nr:protein-disulfide reductase DsbD domain-containing protein [Taibaiella chishuiensis]PSK94867.1 disulfide bond corrector protein DsbC [Taibaiella chishuiensis]